MTVTVPLAIYLFASGVYCPPTEENAFPSRYPLQSCESNSEHLRFDLSSSAFEIARSERNPRKYCLIHTLSSSTRRYCFKKRDIEFVSLKDAELQMIKYSSDEQNDVLWNVTCVYPSVTLARLFYKDMKHGLQPELVLMQTAVYLERSGTELANTLKLNMDYFVNYVTIVIKDDDGDPILIFPTEAVCAIMQSGHTELSLSLRLFGEQILYNIGFSCDMLASLCSELLHRLCRHIDAISAQGNRRWYDDPVYRLLFNRIELVLERRMSENRRRLPP